MNAKLLTADQVRSKLKDRRLSYVAEKCGLTYMSLSRIRKNEGKPSLPTLEKLSEYFAKNK
jgi:transcriptional regulator with XRE-family HTH domain